MDALPSRLWKEHMKTINRMRVWAVVGGAAIGLGGELKAGVAATVQDPERYTSKLKFDSVREFNDARKGLKSQADFAKMMFGALQNAALGSQLSRKLEELAPDLRAAMAKNPQQCGLVQVVIDSGRFGEVTMHDVRYVAVIGVGDSAVQVIAPLVLKDDYPTSINGPREGYRYDVNRSHYLCFGERNGEIGYYPVFMPTLKKSVEEAVEKLRAEEIAKQKEEERKRKEEEEKKKAEELRARQQQQAARNAQQQLESIRRNLPKPPVPNPPPPVPRINHPIPQPRPTPTPPRTPPPPPPPRPVLRPPA